jgi:NADH-quinone oxidoreductase subunit M
MNVILSTIIGAPLLFALIAVFLPERNEEERARVRTIALAGAGVSFFVTTFFAVLGQIGLGEGGGLASAYQENHTWFWNFLFQAHYDLVADGITLPLLVVVTTIFGCAIFHSWKVHERVRLYVILILLVETAVNGVLCSADFVLFAMFWGLLIVPMYLLIRVWGGDGARRAAAWFAGFQTVTLGLIIATAAIIVVEAGAQTSDMGADLTTFSMTAETVGFWLSFVAFAIAMAVFPVHTWMIEAQSKASAGVATILSGTMLLLGAYGMMRISLTVFPVPAHYYSFAITGLAVAGAFWGSIGALRQDELRRFIGYMNVAQMSLVLLAIGAQTSIALVGAVLLLAGQGFGSAILTLVSGAVEERTRTTSIRAMGGLVTQAPRLAGFYLVAAASVIGIPLLAGFTGDLMVFTGSFPEHRIATVLVMASVIVTTGGLLWVANRVFFGPARDQFVRVRDVTLLDLTVLIPLVAAVVLFGVRAGAVVPVIANGVLEITSRITGA